MPNRSKESACDGQHYRSAWWLVQPCPQRFSNERSKELPEVCELLKIEPLVIGSNRVFLRLLVSDSVTEVHTVAAPVESDEDVAPVR